MNIQRLSWIVLIFATILTSCQARSIKTNGREKAENLSLDEMVRTAMRRKLIEQLFNAISERRENQSNILEDFFKDKEDEVAEELNRYNRPRPGRDEIYRPRPGRDASENEIPERRKTKTSFNSLVEEWFQKIFKRI